MTVSTTSNKVSYIGNGVTTTFAVPYYFLDEADLTVILAQAGVETTLTITTDYTVTGAGDPAGGSIETVATYTASDTIYILREVDYTQPLDLVENDPLPAESVEEAFDRLTMQVQQIAEITSRSLVADVSSGISVDGLAEIVANIDEYISDAETAATNAGTSETNAAASAAAALASKTNAAASESAASTSASAAQDAETTALAAAAEASGYASVGFDVASTIYDFGFITDATLTFSTDYGSVAA